jgi:hypothetical protein
MIPDLILVFVALTCLRLVLKTVREALKMVREAWDLWDRCVARKGVPGEEESPARVSGGEVGGDGRGAAQALAHEQLTLWE